MVLGRKRVEGQQVSLGVLQQPSHLGGVRRELLDHLREPGAGQDRWHAQPQHRQRLGHPLAQRGGGARMGLVQLCGQHLELGLGVQRGRGMVGRSHPTLDRPAEVLGQPVADVADLVLLASGDHRVVEHVQDGAA